MSDLDGSNRDGTRKMRFWECRCDCGRVIIVAEDDLLSGKVTSCGQCDKPTGSAKEHDALAPDSSFSTRAH